MKRIPPFRNRRDVFYLVHEEPTKESKNGIYIVKPKDNSYRAIWAVVWDVPLKLMSTSDGYTKEEVDKIISTIKDYQKENDKLLENIKLEISKLNSEKADRTELANVVAGLVPMGSVANLAELETKPKRSNDAYYVEDQLSPEGNAYIYRWDAGLNLWVNTKQVVFKDVITQGLGDSSNKAMSQKAVTDEIAQLADDIIQVETDLNQLEMQYVGEATLSNNQTSAGTFLYKIPSINVGKFYTFNLHLKNPSAGVMYWNIRINGSTMLFTNNKINQGATESTLYHAATDDYPIVELWVYSGASIPALDLKITADVSLNSKIKNLEDVSEVVENTYPNIGEFYMNAWVRYSDGLISGSAGGVKLYKILRESFPENAKKIIANVSTENNLFAAIAFYSTPTPSTESYIKSHSVQGLTDTTGRIYEASIPEEWACAVVLNMSQYFQNPSIKTDVLLIPTNEYIITKVNESKSLHNVFSNTPFYHHLNQEMTAARQSIPAQSLLDISYGKLLGYDMIEANIHQCSDGVLVCKHGESGALGQGIKSVDGLDYSLTKFSSVTSTWLRENITYSCNRSKFETYIPTLDEFASKCKEESMKIKIGNNSSALEVVRKYFPDDMIFMTANSRINGFRGTIEYVWAKNAMTVADCITNCKKIGAPLQITIASGAISSMSDAEIAELTNAAHINGFGVGVVYTSTNQNIKLLNLGVDSICSTYRQINLFNSGNAINIVDLADNKINKSVGAIYNPTNDIIEMGALSYFEVLSDRAFDFGKVSISIRYSGNLTISCGTDVGPYNLQEFASNGDKVISFALAISPDSPSKFNKWIRCTANQDTTIYNLKIFTSYI